MREFRGTVIALVLFLALGAFFLFREKTEVNPEPKQIFSFEKHEVIGATITRPGKEEIRLVEKEGKWWINGTKWQANLTMVNRIRHQLHDLKARAKVSTEGNNFELYGLGKDAIRVELSLRSGDTITFLAGDPNPTGVSYYIRPLPGDTVYTVKKSALDYYSAPLDSFRNQHFVSMDTQSVQSFQVWNEQGEFQFQRLDEHRWELLAPKMRVSTDIMRTMIGRAIALKASRFIDPVEQNQDYGLSNPVLRIAFTLETGTSIEFRVGNKTEEQHNSYFQLEGDPVVYVAKNGLLDEFDIQPEELRNREVMDVREAEIQQIFFKNIEKNTALEISLVSDTWRWENEKPISGSTPDRVLSSVANLRAMEFTTPDKLGQPIGEVRLVTKEGEERILRLGASAPEKDIGDAQTITRRYAQVFRPDEAAELSEPPETIIIDEYVLRLMHELEKEWERSQE